MLTIWFEEDFQVMQQYGKAVHPQSSATLLDIFHFQVMVINFSWLPFFFINHASDNTVDPILLLPAQ